MSLRNPEWTELSRAPARAEPREGARHALGELLFALGVAWIVLTVHSLAAPHWTLFGTELATAEILPLPAAESEPPQLGAPLAPTSRGLASAAPVVGSRPAMDQSPQRILLIGDSMVDNLMLRLADYCRRNGHELHPAIWYASTTADWAREPHLSELLAQFDPSLVMIALGSSELTTPHVERAAPAIRAILRRIGSRKLIWIGPPNWRADTGINALLAQILGPGRFFRSAELEFQRGADGIHPTAQSAARWMDAVTAWTVHASDYPIRLEIPTEPAPRPAARVFPPPR